MQNQFENLFESIHDGITEVDLARIALLKKQRMFKYSLFLFLIVFSLRAMLHSSIKQHESINSYLYSFIFIICCSSLIFLVRDRSLLSSKTKMYFRALVKKKMVIPFLTNIKAEISYYPQQKLSSITIQKAGFINFTESKGDDL